MVLLGVYGNLLSTSRLQAYDHAMRSCVRNNHSRGLDGYAIEYACCPFKICSKNEHIHLSKKRSSAMKSTQCWPMLYVVATSVICNIRRQTIVSIINAGLSLLSALLTRTREHR